MNEERLHNRRRPGSARQGLSWMLIFLLLVVLLLPGAAQAYRQGEMPAEAVVPELVQLGLDRVVVERHSHKRLSRLPDHQDRYFLIIRLGQLTEKEFRDVNALYGNHATVDYDPDRNYRLKDFLPPVVQAVLNRTFRPIKYDLSFLGSSSYQRRIRKLRKSASLGEDSLMVEGLLWKGLTTETNCWNATIETLNAINGGSSIYRVFTPARWEADLELKTSSAGRALGSRQKHKPWDVLLISQKSPYTGQEILQHTALLVGRKLVFEKVDSSGAHPYRLSLLDDVLSKYRTALADTFRMEYRRYLRGHRLFQSIGRGGESLPGLTAKIIGKAKPEVRSGKLSYGCDSGQEDRCIYSFQVVERLTVEPGYDGARLRGNKAVLHRFRSLEN